MSTTILVRADRIIVHLRSFEIVILIDTRMRKRFNLRDLTSFRGDHVIFLLNWTNFS
jgi:hypothetical protein